MINLDKIEKDLEQFKKGLATREKQFLEKHGPNSLKDTVSLDRVMVDILEILFYPYRRRPKSSDNHIRKDDKIRRMKNESKTH